MTAQFLDGDAFLEKVKRDLAIRAEALRPQGVVPGLGTILVGTDPNSVSYVRRKHANCAEIGFASFNQELPESATQEDVSAAIAKFNRDPLVDAFLVQLPLPRHLSEEKTLLSIDPDKDVDGFHPINVGKVFIGERDGFSPATPAGVQQLLLRSSVDTAGKHCVIIGRSNIVGKPMASLMVQNGPGGNATVTVCHSHTRDLAEHAKRADILIVAIGRPRMVTADMVKSGAVVIDVGVNRVDNPAAKKGYSLVGDVDFEAVRNVASKITPVPGGVGPMTIAMLLSNTLRAAERVHA